MDIALIEHSHRLWSAVLEGLRADVLDCLQSNLAAIADLRYGRGAHLALGSALSFTAITEASGAPAIDVSLERRLAEARELLGLRVAQRWDGVDGRELRQLAREHGPLYVVADAYDLPWGPYAGREHMEHSFLLAGGRESCFVVDAYCNATRWGEARPGFWALPATELDAAVSSATAMVITAHGVPATSRPMVVSGNARSMANAVPAIERYVEAIRRRSDDVHVVRQIVLDVWILHRSRALHAAWLEASAVADAVTVDAARQADAWQAFAGQTYVALRRAERRGGLSPAVIDELASLLQGDVALAARIADAAGPIAAGPTAAHVAARVRAVVAEELQEAMQDGDGVVDLTVPLRQLPNYSSFRLVDVIERIESRLNVEVDAEQLTAASLSHFDSLCRLFMGARARWEVLPV